MSDHKLMQPIRIALPKGRLFKLSTQVLSSFGFQETQRRLSFEMPGGKHRIFMIKPRDIPKLIYDGEMDFGLAPDEWLIEERLKRGIENADLVDGIRVIPVIPLGIRVSLLTCVEVHGCEPIRRIVTEFPNITARFVADRRMDVHILHVHGSSEAFVPGVADACIDCVETGATARLHKLMEKYIIFDNLGLSVLSNASKHDTVAEAILTKLRGGSTFR